VTHNREPITIRKNRKRAFWSLVIILFMVPISILLTILGLQPGRPDVAWSLVLFGVVGVLAFVGSAIAIIRTMRAPWHLALSPAHLTLYTANYDLRVPWDQITGIAVDEVNGKPGCALIFGDVDEVVKGAEFHVQTSRRDAVTDAATMMARMEDNVAAVGYHLGIPGRLLEKAPEEMAELLVRARTGGLWEEGGGQG
jgi:hypothetical protein